VLGALDQVVHALGRVGHEQEAADFHPASIANAPGCGMRAGARPARLVTGLAVTAHALRRTGPAARERRRAHAAGSVDGLDQAAGARDAWFR